MMTLGVILIAVLAVVIANLVTRYRLRHEQDSLKKTLKLFRVHLVCMGAFCIVLWFLLPMTPVLSTFGYPKTARDIQSTESLLRYLQDYNRALVRTTQVLHWFIFVFGWWFIAMLFELSKTLSTKIDKADLVSPQSQSS